MRTSLTLDDDVYQLARLYASGRGTTLSAAINDIVRSVGQGPHSAPGLPGASSRIVSGRNGLRVIAARGRVITSEMVKQALEDEGA